MWKYVSLALLLGASVAAGIFWCMDLGYFERLSTWLFERYQVAGLVVEGAFSLREIQVAAVVALAFFMAWVVVEGVHLGRVFLVFSGAAFLTVTLSPTLALYNVLFEPFSGLVALVGSLLLGLVFSFTRTGRRRRSVGLLLGKRLQKSEMIAASRADSAAVRPEKRDVTVVTVRILNAGDLVESLGAADVVKLSRRFFSGCRGNLLAAGACVEEVAPDCLRACFGCFPGSENHAIKACQAAVSFKEVVRKCAEECEKQWGERLQYGIAVTTGEAALGVYGCNGRRTFGAMGEVVEFGRRLCAANRIYGSSVLLGALTWKKAQEGVEVRPMDMLFDPSTNAMTEIYELLDEKGKLSVEEAARRDHFWEGVVFWREGKHADAVASFERAVTDEVSDYPLEYFLSRARKQTGASSAQRASGRPDHALSTESL